MSCSSTFKIINSYVILKLYILVSLRICFWFEPSSNIRLPNGSSHCWLAVGFDSVKHFKLTLWWRATLTNCWVICISGGTVEMILAKGYIIYGRILHCTSNTIRRLIVGLSWLETAQKYVPVFWRMTGANKIISLITLMLSVNTLPSSLYHLIVGFGLPSALHEKLTFWYSKTTTLLFDFRVADSNRGTTVIYKQLN